MILTQMTFNWEFLSPRATGGDTVARHYNQNDFGVHMATNYYLIRTYPGR